MKTIDADGAGSGTAVEEIYIYDGLREERGNAGDHILLAFDESDALTHRYLHGPEVDQVLASEEVISASSEGDVLWALTDHLGTVRDLVDYDAGTHMASVVNHLRYDAFGNIIGESNTAVDFLFSFTGRERDDESDLQYSRARYYDAQIGRWTSEDPIGFNARDTNLTRYVGNNPTGYLDPSGLAKKTVDSKLKNYTFFLEWWPEKMTGEMKVLRQVGSKTEELAILKYVVNCDTGEGVVHVVNEHARKALPGIAASRLKRLTPEITRHLDDIVRKVGGTWVASELAEAGANKAGQKVFQGLSSKVLLRSIGAAFGAFFEVAMSPNTCQAQELPRSLYIPIDVHELGLSDEGLSDFLDYLEDPTAPGELKSLDELAEEGVRSGPISIPTPTGTPKLYPYR